MAASGKDIRAGRAFVELYTLDRMTAGLRAAQARLNAFAASIAATGRNMLAMGLAVGAPLAFAVKQFADLGSELVDMADRTGFTVEQLGELRFAAAQSGASFEDLENAIKFMQKGGFGESAEDFEKLADEISKMGSQTQKVQRILDVFGRGGLKMLPLFKDGAAGIRELREEAVRLGVVMSDADARAAEAFGDQMAALWLQFKMIVVTIGNALVPALRSLIGSIKEGLITVKDFISENRYLVVILGLVAADLVQTGIRCLILAPILRILATSVGLLALSFKLLHVNALLFWGIIGLLIGGIIHFTGVAQTFSGAIAEIVAALTAGDLRGAMNIGWLAIKAIWLEGVAFIKEIWRTFSGGVVDTWHATVFVFQRTWQAIKVGFAQFINFIANLWDGLVRTMTTQLMNLLVLVRNAAAAVPGLVPDANAAVRAIDRVIENSANVANAREMEATRRRREREAGIAAQAGALGQLTAQQLFDQVAREQLRGQAADRDREAFARAKEELAEAIRIQAKEREFAGGAAPVLPRLTGTLGRETDVAGSFAARAVGGLGLGNTVADQLNRANQQLAEANGHLRDIRNQGVGGLAVV